MKKSTKILDFLKRKDSNSFKVNVGLPTTNVVIPILENMHSLIPENVDVPIFQTQFEILDAYVDIKIL